MSDVRSTEYVSGSESAIFFCRNSSETDRMGQGLSNEECCTLARDPVCKMDVDEKAAPARADYEGDQYYFCSEDCKRRFIADPERYVSRSEHSQT